jgi:hypothetical protein
MKTTTKFIAGAIAAVALFFTTSTVKAQDSQNVWRLGIGLEAGVPTGNAGDVSNFELGGTARLQYDLKSNISLMLTSGYYNMFGKKLEGTDLKYPSIGIVPVKLGLKAFFAPKWYVSGEAGAGFETNEGGNTKLILAPGIGWAGNHGVDVGLRYENFSGQNVSYGLVGLRVAYGFTL